MSGAESLSLKSVRSFLSLVCEGEPPSLDDLIEALDQAVLAYSQAPIGEPSPGDKEPPSSEYDALYGVLGSRFPEFGYYGVADPLVVVGEAKVGDAIDDLADIVSDLREVVWMAQTFGVDDAHWTLRHLYEIHWGYHARSLAFYLYALRFQ